MSRSFPRYLPVVMPVFLRSRCVHDVCLPRLSGFTCSVLSLLYVVITAFGH